jgi:hypothetical protein
VTAYSGVAGSRRASGAGGLGGFAHEGHGNDEENARDKADGKRGRSLKMLSHKIRIYF